MKKMIPKGWRTVAIGDIVKVIGGFAFKSSDFEENGYPVIRISNLAVDSVNLSNCARIPKNKLGKGSRFKLEPGDILIAMSGATTGKLGFVPDDLSEDWYLNQRVGAFRIPHGSAIDQAYFRLLLCTEFYQSHVWNLAAGAAQPNISGKQLESAIIPLPPLAEQKRIAAILDAADALRVKRRETLAQLDTLLQSAFLDMFGDPVTNPMGWEVVSVGGEVHFLTSGSRGWAKYYADDGNIFIRIQNLKNGRLDLGDIAYVEAPESAEAKRTKVEPGDVLLSITADLGRTAVVPLGIGKAHINQHLAILRFINMNPVFVSFQLASNGGQSQFSRLNREGVKAGLNFNDVKSIQLTKPPLDLQHRFAIIVESAEKQKTRQRTHLAELDTLFTSLQSRAFNGEL